MEIRRIVLAPDSFKGTMSAREVCQVEKQALLEVFPQAHITCLPMADGGEGLTDTCLGLGSQIQILGIHSNGAQELLPALPGS